MNLKFIGVVFALLATYSAALYTGNGEPSCKTQEDMDTRIFRNHWDPTAFWKCVKINEPAVLIRCPEEQAFMDNVKDCLPWDEWKWQEPIAPVNEANIEVMT